MNTNIFIDTMTIDEINEQIPITTRLAENTGRKDAYELVSSLIYAKAILQERIAYTELNLNNENVATKREKEIAQETWDMMIKAGYDGTYAGGSRGKGNGFWIGQGKYSLGYLSCVKIKSQLKKYGDIMFSGEKQIRDAYI